MPVVIRKISLFCSLRLFSPTSLQRAKNAYFSLIFPGKSAFWNGFKLRRFDVKKDFFFDLFLRFAAESSSDNFRFLLANSVSGGVGDKTRDQFDSNVTWVRIPPSAPKAAPCGVLLFIFAANYARAARWDSNSPCPALCVPPGKMPRWGIFRARENPTVCAKYHYSILHWVVIFCCFAKFRSYFYRHLPFIFK